MTAQPAAVIDASVWVSRLMPQESNHAASVRWFDRHEAGGGTFVVPVLLLAEAAGAIARLTDDTALGNQAATDLLALATVAVVHLDQQLAMRAAELAAGLRLRGADAVYVAVAEYLSVPLVTWDREQLTRAASHITVRTP